MYGETHAPYLEKCFRDRKRHLGNAIRTLKNNNVIFDSIVCTGISGIMFASPLSLTMEKNIVVVRKKDEENNHSDYRIESSVEPENLGRWIFVDDLVASGDTYRYVLDSINRWKGLKQLDPLFVGRYLYKDNVFTGFRPKEDEKAILALF